MQARQRTARRFAIITGGGTAGHVQPALAVAEALVARGHAPSTIGYVGARRGIEAKLVPEAGFEVTLLPGRGIQRRFTPENLGAVAGLMVAFVLALAIVIRRRPRVVVTVGGYAGLPCAFAAVVVRVPVVVLSYDAVAGSSNRLVARFARKCAVAFEGAGLPNQVVTGAPLRSAVLEVDRTEQGVATARAGIGVSAQRFLIVVAGGSLGAGRLNAAALELAHMWASRGDITIYHVAGERNLSAVEAQAAGLGLGLDGAASSGLDYRLVGYEPKMPSLLAACDLAVLRSGASTVAEVAAIGAPSILVPLPGAPHDHQTRNAEALATRGGALLLLDAECDAARLSQTIDSLRSDPERLAKMSLAAAAAGHRDAAERIAALVESVAGGSR
ncbi:MAG: glycosyltransferase [Acidimicrobiales bacterium]|jgi:UDP-N-acetylglucosamine--N-acetylmuramyl-(pentapeptide) pyrophosphoryl-undecaprenol N-acetylglucosamine transferase